MCILPLTMISNEAEVRWAAKTPSRSFCTKIFCRVGRVFLLPVTILMKMVISVTLSSLLKGITSPASHKHWCAHTNFRDHRLIYLNLNDKTPFALWNFSRLMKTKVTLHVNNRLKFSTTTQQTLEGVTRNIVQRFIVKACNNMCMQNQNRN